MKEKNILHPTGSVFGGDVWLDLLQACHEVYAQYLEMQAISSRRQMITVN